MGPTVEMSNKSSSEGEKESDRRQMKRQGRRRRKELPEAPWAGAWRRPRRRSHHWRTVQRSGEAEGAAWEEGPSEGSPECSYGTSHQPGVRESYRTKME